MEQVRWTRDALCDLAEGRQVFLRDEIAGDRPVPSWLAAAADGLWPLDSADSLEVTHPDDRHTIIEAFIDAVNQPGDPVIVHVRELIDTAWYLTELTWLNLLDDPDVGGIVGTSLVLGPVEGPGTPTGETGEGRTTGWALIELARSGMVSSARGQVERLFGVTAAELTGQPLASFMHPDSVPNSVLDWLAFQSDVTNTRVNRRRFRRTDGTEVWLEGSYLRDPDGTTIGVLIDVTDRVARERELRALTEQLAVLADAVPNALVCCDPHGTVQSHNASWTELVGHRDGTRLHDAVPDADHRRLDRMLADAAGAATREKQVLDFTGADGVSTWQVTLQPVGDPGDGRVIVVSVADVSDQVQLHRAAHHDGLTGLLNRAATEARLADALARDAAGTVVLFLDLDGFKRVNDIHGHEAGDTVLREVARRLRAAVRPDDDVGRFGGDEFVVVCRHVGATTPDDLEGRLAGVLVEPVPFPGGAWPPAASIGHSYARAGDDLAAVLRRADLAMLDAKRTRAARS